MSHGLSVKVHEGDGPYMLLVHGMLASRSQWLLNLEHFSKFATPVTVELLGHHESSAPEEAKSYAPESYVEAFEEIREQLGTDFWVVGGCSLGGALTLRYALAHPKRVSAHFLTNSSSAFADEEMSRVWQERSAAGFQQIIEGGHGAIERMPVHPRHAKRLPEAVKDALVRDCSEHSVYGIAATSRWTSPSASSRSQLNEVSQPTMLLCGRFERRFRPLLEVAKSEIPGLLVHELDAGHGVNMEASELFNHHVETFVSAHV